MNLKNLAMWGVIVFLTIGLYNMFKNPQYSISKKDTIIDIGVSPSEEYSEKVLLQKYPYKNKYTCLSNQDCTNLIKKYKNIKFINGNACKTKLSGNKFNIVYSNCWMCLRE